MDSNTNTRPLRAAIALCLLPFLCACALEDYDAPPEVGIIAPETGTFFVGDALTLEFSEPIKASTLAVQIWAGTRDIENELTAAEPLVSRCTVALSPCAAVPDPEAGEDAPDPTGVVLEVAEDGLTATLQLDPNTYGKADVPFVLEVLSGLEDRDGSVSGTSTFLDYIFKPNRERPSEGPINFDNGVYLIVGQTNEPLPITLSLITDFRIVDNPDPNVEGEDSKVIFSAVKGVAIEGAPKNTQNPDELNVDTEETGFIIIGQGTAKLLDGERFFDTEPFDFSVTVGPIRGDLSGVRLTGKIVKDPDTGKDRLETILSVADVALVVAGNSDPYGAITAPMTGVYVEPERNPEGSPDICTNICGAAGGTCEEPANFSTEGFCD